MSDLRLAARVLARQPAYSLAVIATLALATGVSTGFFGVIDALTLRPLPGVETRGLVNLHVTRGHALDGFAGFSGPSFLELRDRSRSLAGLEAFAGREFVVGDTGNASVVGGQLVSAGFFRLLGTRPLRGRLLSDADDQPGAAPALVISEALWRQRFGGREEVVGQAIRLSGHAFTVVGIAEPGFRGHFVGFPMDAFISLSTAPLVAPDLALDDPTHDSLELLGRLAPGALLVTAQADLGVIAADIARSLPGSERDRGVEVRPYTGIDADLRGPVLGFLAVLAVVGALVLLVACLNVAGLVLARGASRERELAVRTALGADRSDLVRPLLAETAILFVTGGLLGAPLAPIAASALQAFLPQFPVPLRIDVAPDLRLALFASALTLLTGLVFGLLPAARAARVDCASSLKLGGRGITPGRHRARRAFLTAQVALSLVLLVGAGLFLRAMRSARSRNPGFQVEGVGLLTVDASLANRTPAEAQAFFLGWLESQRRRPGVEAASLAGTVPLGFTGPTTRVRVDGLEPPGPDGFPVGWNAVTPGYFETLRIPVLSGRDFAPSDARGSARVVVVSQSTAARLFPGQEPLGRNLRRADQTLRVVGVVGDIATDRSGSHEGLMVYLPFAQTSLTRASLLLRGAGRLPFEEARAAATGLDSSLPVLTAMSLAEHAGAALFPERLAAVVSGAFGLFGLLLASLGLYGLATYVVNERRHELAIRAALGARANDLRRLVLLQGLRPVAVGLGLGLMGAVVFGRLAAAFVPAVGAFDATAFAGGALLLVFVASLATDLPARRAAVTGPAEVLRAE